MPGERIQWVERQYRELSEAVVVFFAYGIKHKSLQRPDVLLQYFDNHSQGEFSRILDGEVAVAGDFQKQYGNLLSQYLHSHILYRAADAPLTESDIRMLMQQLGLGWDIFENGQWRSVLPPQGNAPVFKTVKHENVWGVLFEEDAIRELKNAGIVSTEDGGANPSPSPLPKNTSATLALSGSTPPSNDIYPAIAIPMSVTGLHQPKAVAQCWYHHGAHKVTVNLLQQNEIAAIEGAYLGLLNSVLLGVQQPFKLSVQSESPKSLTLLENAAMLCALAKVPVAEDSDPRALAIMQNQKAIRALQKSLEKCDLPIEYVRLRTPFLHTQKSSMDFQRALISHHLARHPNTPSRDKWQQALRHLQPRQTQSFMDNEPVQDLNETSRLELW